MASSHSSTQDWLNPQQQRDNLSALKIEKLNPIDSVNRCYELIKITTTTEIQCYIYEPKDCAIEKLNTLFYIPGSASRGYAFQATNALSSNLSARLHCRVITILHRLAPENKHPTPFNDVCEVINHYRNSAKIHLNHIAIGGYSSGGLLALQVALEAVRVSITFSQLILISPVVNLEATANLRKLAGSVMSPEFFRDFLKLYLPDNVGLNFPEVSPFHHPRKHQLPPINIVVGEEDILYPSIKEFSQSLNREIDCLHSIINKNHYLAWQEFNYIDQKFLNKINSDFDTESTRPDISRKLELLPYNAQKRFGITPEFNLHSYVARDSLQKEIENRFSCLTGEKAIVENYFGRHGVGKTQLALHYYYCSTHMYEQHFWFDASHADTLTMQYIILGENKKLFQTEISTNEKVALVKDWLEQQSNMLVIYDHANSMSLLDQFIPNKNAHILITSVKPIMKNNGLMVATLNVSESTKLSSNVITLFYSQQNTIDIILAETLKLPIAIKECPIALQQACIYLCKGGSLSTFIEAYNNNIKNPIMENSTEACIWITLDSLPDEISKTFLAFSLLESANIPLDLFADEKSVKDTINSYYMVKINNQSENIFIPTNFQIAMKKYIVEKHSIIEVVGHALDKIQKYIFVGSNSRTENLRLFMFHIQSLLEFIDENNCVNMLNKISLSYLYCAYANALALHFRPKESQAYISKSWQLYKESNAEDIFFENIYMRSEEKILWEAGNLMQGLIVAQDNFNLCKKNKIKLGESSFASSMSNLASFYNRLGDLANAEIMQREALEVLKNIDSNVNLAKTHVLLGFILIHLEKYDDAIKSANQAVLELGKENSFPASNPLYSELIAECYGHAYLGKKETDKAIHYLTISCEARKNKFGEESRLVALTKLKMACAQNDIKKASKYLLSAINIFFSIYKSDNNPYIAECYYDTGNCMLNLNLVELAKLFFYSFLMSIKSSLTDEFYEKNIFVIKVKKILKSFQISDLEVNNKIKDTSNICHPKNIQRRQELLSQLNNNIIINHYSSFKLSSNMTFFSGLSLGISIGAIIGVGACRLSKK